MKSHLASFAKITALAFAVALVVQGCHDTGQQSPLVPFESSNAGANSDPAEAAGAAGNPDFFCGEGDYGSMCYLEACDPCACFGVACEPGRVCSHRFHLGGPWREDCACGSDGVMECTVTWLLPPTTAAGGAGGAASSAGNAGSLEP